MPNTPSDQPPIGSLVELRAHLGEVVKAIAQNVLECEISAKGSDTDDFILRVQAATDQLLGLQKAAQKCKEAASALGTADQAEIEGRPSQAEYYRAIYAARVQEGYMLVQEGFALAEDALSRAKT